MSTPAATEANPPTGEFDLATQRLAGPAVQMAVGTTLSRATGLARTAAMAIALGVSESRLADSYNIANTLPNIIYELVLGGVLSSVFIPVLVEELRTRVRDDRGLDVTYVHTRSGPGPVGRLTVATLNTHGWPPDLQPACFVCGPTGFVEAVSDILVALGHDPRRVRTERFG